MATQETKAEAFVRLANIRVSNAIKAIQLVGNLGSRTSYEYDSKQIAKIVKALQAELDHTKEKFSSNGEDKGGFSL